MQPRLQGVARLQAEAEEGDEVQLAPALLLNVELVGALAGGHCTQVGA